MLLKTGMIYWRTGLPKDARLQIECQHLLKTAGCQDSDQICIMSKIQKCMLVSLVRPLSAVCLSVCLSHFCHRVNLLSADNPHIQYWMGKWQMCSGLSGIYLNFQGLHWWWCTSSSHQCHSVKTHILILQKALFVKGLTRKIGCRWKTSSDQSSFSWKKKKIPFQGLFKTWKKTIAYVFSISHKCIFISNDLTWWTTL